MALRFTQNKAEIGKKLDKELAKEVNKKLQKIKPFITRQFKAVLNRITDDMDDETLRPKLRTLREKQVSLLSNAGAAQAPNAFIEMFNNTFNYLGMTFKAHQHIDAS